MCQLNVQLFYNRQIEEKGNYKEVAKKKNYKTPAKYGKANDFDGKNIFKKNIKNNNKKKKTEILLFPCTR